MRFRFGTGLLLLLFAVPAHAQWSWLYPKPQGHTLSDVVFLDNSTAIAVGEYGTILTTHDGGNTWAVKTKVIGITSDVLRIDRVDENTAVAVGRGGVILRSDDQGASWTLPVSGTTFDIIDVSFVDGGHGIALRGHAAHRTSDGGLTWTEATIVTPTLNAVDMITPIYAMAVGEFGTVLRSADGGATWISDTPLPTTTLLSIDFGDINHGIVGSEFRSYVTSDAGATWTPFLFDPNGQYENHWHHVPNEILYVSPSLSFAAEAVSYIGPDFNNPFEAPSGIIARSDDGGIIWLPVADAARSANGLARNGDGTIIMVGNDGQIVLRHSDGTVVQVGGTVSDYEGGGSHSFPTPATGIVASGDDWYWFSGSTTFSRTSDGGQTWSESRFADATCRDVIHLSANDVYAVGLHKSGNRASVLRSSDGGTTWAQVWSDATIASLGAIARGSNTRAVAVGSSGSALVIDNGIVTPVSTGTAATLADVTFATPSIVLAVGVGGAIIRSIDAGQTWDPITSGITDFLRTVDFVSDNVGFALGAGRIFRSEDGGLTWTLVQSATTPQAASFDFVDENHGVAVGGSGVVMATDDGGATWRDLEVPTPRSIDRVTMFSQHRAYVQSGYDQLLLEYRIAPLPTIITSFDGFASDFAVELRWEVRDDANLSHFDIQRLDTESGAFRVVASNLPASTRTFRDETVVPGRTYDYYLVAYDHDGNKTTSPPLCVTIPTRTFAFLPNHPNPFNPSTTLRFVIPAREHVRVSIYDVAGKHVTTLVDEVRAEGLHTVSWDGRNSAGVRVASGVYISRMENGNRSATRKMVLLK